MNVGSHALNRAEAALLDLDLEALRSVVAENLAMAPKLGVFETLVAPALERIGRAWEEGDLALAQVYMASRLVERLVEEHLVSG